VQEEQDTKIDFSNETILYGFLRDISYLTQTFFTHPQYLCVKSRPVVFLCDDFGCSGKIQEAMEEARNAVQSQIGLKLYIIHLYHTLNPPTDSLVLPRDVMGLYGRE
jgi:hypothetical protein